MKSQLFSISIHYVIFVFYVGYDLLFLEASWSRLSSKEKAEKEAFLRSEESVGSGFMKMVSVNLRSLLC